MERYCPDCKQMQPVGDFYLKHGKPWGYCKPCTRKRTNAYYHQHQDSAAACNRRMRLSLRLEAVQAYDGKCQCCGEITLEFLSIDHINGGGREHAKACGGSLGMLRDIKRQGWPKDKYRILCWNCNLSLGVLGYCPHQGRPAAETNDRKPLGNWKICPVCKQRKRLSEFYRPEGKRAGPYCKPCTAMRRRERRQDTDFLPDLPAGIGILRYCPTCKLWKIASQDFHRHYGYGQGGFQVRCKTCARTERLAKKDQCNKAERIRDRKLRLEIVRHFGGKCECCGEKHWEFLAVDHRKGDGKSDRKLFPRLGRKFYIHLKKLGFPKARYRLLCHNCNGSWGLRGYCPHQGRPIWVN